MQPRPLYRWKSFWFGLSVLMFLGWASWHSTRVYSGVSWLGTSMARMHAHTLVCWRSPYVAAEFDVMTVALDAGASVDDEVAVARANDIGMIALPDWMTTSLLAISWTAFLTWRWRRDGRRAAINTNPP